jgi:ABC-type transporter Mla subunit MlaD
MLSRLLSNRSEDRAAQRAGLVVLGVATMAFGAFLAYVGYKAPDSIPGRSYYTLRAEFSRADNLSEHYQVRMNGRLIGQVLNPRQDGGRALVDLQLKSDAGPLLADTRLRVRPRSAIGVRFVEVTPGTRGRPLPNGALIPASQTSASLPLDDAGGILDHRRRAKLRTLLVELGDGTAGRGEDLNTAVGKGDAFFAGLASALAPVNHRPGATAGFVAGLEGLSAAAAPVRRTIAEGFRPEAQALRPVAAHAGDVHATLERAPGALDAARTQLPPTRALLVQTAAFARAATPTLRLAPRALKPVSALLREARPSLRDAEATLHLAGRVVDPTLDLLRVMRPVLPSADTTLADSLPLVSELARHSCDITMFGRNWADATAHGDAGGQFLRLAFVRPGPEQLAGLGKADKSMIHQNSYPAPCRSTTEPGR